MVSALSRGLAVRRLTLLLPGVLVVMAGEVRAEPSVRVRVAEGLEAVALAGDGLEVDGRPAAGEALLTIRGGQLLGAGGPSSGPVEVRAAGGVSVGGRRYPGHVVVVPTAPGAFDVVNVVPLERYVPRAVAAEVYADWPIEALKAQAVVARTYALYSAGRPAGPHYDLEASVVGQGYAGAPPPEAADRAAALTRGEFLAYRREPILAAFHSASGGRTASSEEVWGQSLPYLRSVASPDDEAPDHFWSYAIPLDALRAALRDAGVDARGDAAAVEARTGSGRAARVRVAGIELTGRELRAILGGRALRSTLYEVRVRDGVVHFLGSGAGHGVGLSQWGARELALRGRPYTSILAHYYPGTALRQLADLELARSWESP